MFGCGEHRGRPKVLCSAFDVADNTELLIRSLSWWFVSIGAWEQQVGVQGVLRPIALILERLL